MKKKLLIGVLVIVCLFSLSGCKKSETSQVSTKGDDSEKVVFTKEIVHDSSHVKYKLPESESSGFFKDLGHSCSVSHYTNQTSVAALYPYDDKVDKIDKIEINGFTYETYKYIDNMSTTYIYRTKINNDYHLFEYYTVNTNYDDSQVEKFMNTVEYIYDSIDYKQS